MPLRKIISSDAEHLKNVLNDALEHNLLRAFTAICRADFKVNIPSSNCELADDVAS